MSAGSGLFSKQKASRSHLVKPGGGVAGEVADLRSDIEKELSSLAAIVVEEFTNPRAADTDGIKTSIASSDEIQVYQGAALNGAVGGLVMSPPRNITITTTMHGDIDAVDVVVDGVDVNGDPISETITLTNGGGTTDVGDKAFAKVTKITVPAQSGAGGALEFGFGELIGLGKKIKSRAGAVALIKEIAAGSVVTNGTVVDAATGAPNGTYEPNTPADADIDYAIYYEADFS